MIPKVFIHIPKNGGMTIRRSPLLRDKVRAATPDIHKSKEYSNAVLTTMNKNNDHHGYEHARWRDLKRSVVEGFGSFAIVRNPWDRVVSRYFFAKKVIEVEMGQPASYADVTSFEAFIEERHKWGDKDYMWHRAVRGWYPALDHVTDEKGNIKCDILSFEDYNSDVMAYFNLSEMSRARNVTAMNKGIYTDVYTPETRNIIGDWYKDDIETFGYDFGTGPTKNLWRMK